jgi:hypothetical protein
MFFQAEIVGGGTLVFDVVLKIAFRLCCRIAESFHVLYYFLIDGNAIETHRESITVHVCEVGEPRVRANGFEA